jgi:hypothetical protein
MVFFAFFFFLQWHSLKAASTPRKTAYYCAEFLNAYSAIPAVPSQFLKYGYDNGGRRPRRFAT